MKRSEMKAPGIFINCKDTPYCSWIFSGIKDIETRFAKTLDPFVGKRVWIIQTGTGEAYVWGYVTVTGKKVYNSFPEWAADYKRHWVNDGLYSFVEGKKKYGYIFSEPHRLVEPYYLHKGYFTGDRVAVDLSRFGFESF